MKRPEIFGIALDARYWYDHGCEMNASFRRIWTTDIFLCESSMKCFHKIHGYQHDGADLGYEEGDLVHIDELLACRYVTELLMDSKWGLIWERY